MDAIRSRLLHKVKTKTPLKTIKAIHSSKTKPPNGILIRGDIVGPPNPVSNIRPITFYIPQNETSLERKYRLKREEVHQWHEQFWLCHNNKFMTERRKFIDSFKKQKGDLGPLSPDEISVFYKSFLDKYWTTHMYYNIEWYKQNTKLLALALSVEINRLKQKFFSRSS